MEVKLTPTVTLNGQEVVVTVFEDTDGDGASENQETVYPDDGTNDYQLPSLEGDTANDYWMDVSLNTTDTSTTPTIDGATFEITESPGVDSGPLERLLVAVRTNSDSRNLQPRRV